MGGVATAELSRNMGEGLGHPLGEEDSGITAVTGAGAFQCRQQALRPERGKKRPGGRGLRPTSTDGKNRRGTDAATRPGFTYDVRRTAMRGRDRRDEGHG